MEQEISQRIDRAIHEKVFPGCVVGVVQKNGDRIVLPFGHFTYDSGAHRVKEDTIFDIASMTKSIPTGSIALKLIDEGTLKLDDKLIDYLPEFRNSDRERVLIKHLLTYTLDGYGLARAVDNADGLSLHKRTFTDLLEVLFTHEFEERPGTVFKYTNIPMALLGLALEKITGDTLDNLAHEYFFKPLAMNRTTFYPERFPVDEIVPTEKDDWRGLVHGVVHDESAYLYKREGKIAGHAGLFSTAPDILHFLEMLLHEGELNGTRYFSKEIITQMHTNQIEELGQYTGLGWELYQPRYMGNYCTPNTFGKTGFTGTLCVCDIEKERAYVLLSNRTFPKRPNDSTAIHAVRADIGDIVLKV